MPGPSVTNAPDLLLQQYAACDDPQRAETLLETLIVDHAQPGIRKIVRYKLAFQGAAEAQDIDDVASEVLLELIGRLRAIRDSGDTASIGTFSGYTAVSAYHACNEYLRRKYPNRHRLKTRLRYLLNTESHLAIWESSAAEWVCGRRDWQFDGRPPADVQAVRNWKSHLGEIPHGRGLATQSSALVTRILESFGGPVEFDELVSIMGQIWGVDDPPQASEKSAREVESGATDPGVLMDLRRWLNELWIQIRQLPHGQRSALLLNLRTGPGAPAATLLPVTGVASMSEIAECLGYLPQEFADVWKRLPLDDLAIAERLGLTRQQVINLRKSARERLTRRIGGKYRLQ